MLSLFPDVQVKTNLSDAETNISCSPVHIKKILMNLLTNAAESISGAGTIHIETGIRQIDSPLPDAEKLPPGIYVTLQIRDSGQGIAECDIKHIFEPFYSKKVMGRSGTGLGLAIVWNTVQEHNGAVTVTSSRQGTSFMLYFPASTTPLQRTEKSSDSSRYRGRGESILVVDDVPQQRDIAVRMLSSLGYSVETAGSGEEAIKRLQEQKFDMLILDMIMDPGINGCRTFEQVLKFRPDQRAIIASGFSESEDVKKARRLGAMQFIRKPYTLEQLGTAVRNALT
jgi:CheY-like chemotaxis protein